mgnify:FL=1
MGDNTHGGDLAAGTKVFAWRDDGDNIFEPQSGESALFPAQGGSASGGGSAAVLLNDTVYAIADALHTPAIPANTPKYFGLAWCAGDLSVNLTTGAMQCSGAALGNIAQTDSFSVDLSLTARSAADEPQFTCDGKTPDKPGLGEQIGLLVKCKTIAKMGWPMPRYETECPNGFGRNNTQAAAPASAQPASPPSSGEGGGRTDRPARTR